MNIPTITRRMSSRRSSAAAAMAVWSAWSVGLWRPWYAALWVEAAALAGAPDTEQRLLRGGAAARENPIAATIVRRAGDLVRGEWAALAVHAATFADLGCPYQQERTLRLLQLSG